MHQPVNCSKFTIIICLKKYVLRKIQEQAFSNFFSCKMLCLSKEICDLKSVQHQCELICISVSAFLLYPHFTLCVWLGLYVCVCT